MKAFHFWGAFFVQGEHKKMMNENIVLTVIEIAISLLLEGVIFAMIIQRISDNTNEKQQEHLKHQMENLEKQNRNDFEDIIKTMEHAKTEIISQIKESN